MYFRYYGKWDSCVIFDIRKRYHYVPIYIDDKHIDKLDVYDAHIIDRFFNATNKFMYVDVFMFYGRLFAKTTYFHRSGRINDNNRVLMLSSFVHISLLNEKQIDLLEGSALSLISLPLNAMLLDVL